MKVISAAFFAFAVLVGIEQSAAACSTNLDCSPTLPVCGASVAGVCGPCSNDNDCVGRGNLHVCALSGPSAGACIGCIADGDCVQDFPRCSGNAASPGTCVTCNDDTNCTSYPAARACQPSDGITTSPGTCRQCSATNATLCTGATPACYDVNGACQLCTVATMDAGANNLGCADAGEGRACQGSGSTVFCGCAANNECDTNTIGSICNGITHECRACDVDAGECPVNTACAATGPRAGHCVACVDDSTCASPTVCDSAKNACVGCLTNANCKNPTPRCDSETCVACTSDSDCATSSSGHVCAKSGSTVGQCVQPIVDAGADAGGFDSGTIRDSGSNVDSGEDEQATGGDDSGCGCTVDDRSGGSAWGGLALFCVSLGIARRRVRRRS